ncbi:MAG: SH3 domain-containing protein [Firmicutes bacterium]|nr:SH3 domain-containing protein [Bacillota bacterium]
MTMKPAGRFIAVFTAVLLMLSVFASFSGMRSESRVYADTEVAMSGKATVKEGPLNVRSGPGTNYSRLGQLAQGTTVAVVAKVTNSSGNVWYKYQFNSSKYGYIYSQYVSVSSSNTETALSNKKAKVVEGPLNVRSGPGTNYSKLGQLAQGKEVTLVSQVTNSAGSVWYKYKYNSSTYGYIYSQYVKVSDIAAVPSNTETALTNKRGTVKEGPLNVRSGPGTSYSKLGKIQQGTTVTLLSQIKTSTGSIWYKYQFDSSRYGYLASQYVTVSDIPTATETALTNKIAVVDDGPLNVRSGPGTNYSKLGKLAEGKEIALISQVKNTAGNIWYKYQFAEGKFGYVYSDYVIVKDAPADSEKPAEPEEPEKPAAVKTTVGTVTTDSGYTLNVRSGPGTGYSKIGSLNSGAVVTIIGSEKASNGKTWYKYQFSSSKVGYICADYVSVKTITSTSDFESYLTAQGFPESYKPALRALHDAHPQWVFKAYSVGCSWDTAVAKENARPGINVVSPSSPVSYRSKDSDCYSTQYGWSRYDGSWYSAHTDVIRYYMDPRNFLDETGIYQFMTQQYDASTQSADTVASVIENSFMKSRNPGGGYTSFAPLINDAGKNSGVNPNVLAAMIIQEQGVKGTSGLISGTHSEYPGYYNFFNVGAYTTSTMSAVQRGLWYAKEQGWNTVYKSILGGAQFYANGYVNKNQYTYYTKKFNVKNGVDKIGTHQYMTNVEGAYGEGKLLKNAFPSNYNKALVFEIPVYSSMPASACPLP